MISKYVFFAVLSGFDRIKSGPVVLYTKFGVPANASLQPSCTYVPINCEFYDCKFITKKLVETRINDNYYEGCSFFGEFRGMHLGAATDVDGVPTRWPKIALRGCDFSNATMSWCHLYRLDIASTIFPLWPCFTIVNPNQNRLYWINAELPFSQRIIDYIDISHTDAIMLNWSTRSPHSF